MVVVKLQQARLTDANDNMLALFASLAPLPLALGGPHLAGHSLAHLTKMTNAHLKAVNELLNALCIILKSQAIPLSHRGSLTEKRKQRAFERGLFLMTLKAEVLEVWQRMVTTDPYWNTVVSVHVLTISLAGRTNARIDF